MERTKQVINMPSLLFHCLALTAKICFSSLLLAIIPSFFKPSDALQGNNTDHLVLLAFKSKITLDPHGVLASWNTSSHFCNWEGITCGSKHRRRVIGLDLRSKDLVGNLSPNIGNLSFLRAINLRSNHLRGEIPPQFGHLLRLRFLNLAFNSLVGTIPGNLSQCGNLSVLFFRGNKLAGNIPSELEQLSNLKNLTLSENELNGNIPRSFGNLSSLEAVYAHYNHLTGMIPDELGQLKNLKWVGFGANNLSRVIPPSIFNSSSLNLISMPLNQFHGQLPSNIGITCTNLETLYLSTHLFTGSIPLSLSNATKLQGIDLGDNGFTGNVPVDFGLLQELQILVLAANDLGEDGVDDNLNFLITSLANCSRLQFLELEDNRFAGRLPASIANLSTQLQQLNLRSNRLYGEIPIGIGDLVGLKFLSIKHNLISGNIPYGIGKLHKLNFLDLAYNKFSGNVPPVFGNLASLLNLYLESNKFTGSIPQSLGKAQGLLELYLSNNQLSGPLPEEIFQISSLSIMLNLSANHFIGEIPSAVGNLKLLTTLDLSDNDISGEITDGFISCTQLESIFLGGNELHGSIPRAFGALKSMQALDLSRNKLSDQLPRFLETLPLIKLNLSFNDFQGEVPTKGVFANVTSISLVGNDKLCGGRLELQLPKCPTSRKIKNHHMLHVRNIILSIISSCIFVGVVLVCCMIFRRLQKRTLPLPLTYIPSQEMPIVSHKQLLEATNNFSSTNLIGVGHFGSVYKGTLDEESDGMVAIKVLNLHIQGATKSFIAECQALATIRHRNLVKIITCCSSIDYQGNDFKAIVYRFMQNGSLDKWLHPVVDGHIQNEPPTLSLLQRIHIATDVACGLDYLHNEIEKQIVHCDLKPSNVLLDEEMTAHISDFGLSKFLPSISALQQSSSLGLRGTIGYAAPEYGVGSELSKPGDIYSYGIILLELMTGKQPTDTIFEGGSNMHDYAKMALPDKVINILDPTLLSEYEGVQDSRCQHRDAWQKCSESMVQIGVQCSMESPQNRMEVHSVLHELQKLKHVLGSVETQPPARPVMRHQR